MFNDPLDDFGTEMNPQQQSPQKNNNKNNTALKQSTSRIVRTVNPFVDNSSEHDLVYQNSDFPEVAASAASQQTKNKIPVVVDSFDDDEFAGFDFQNNKSSSSSSSTTKKTSSAATAAITENKNEGKPIEMSASEIFAELEQENQNNLLPTPTKPKQEATTTQPSSSSSSSNILPHAAAANNNTDNNNDHKNLESQRPPPLSSLSRKPSNLAPNNNNNNNNSSSFGSSSKKKLASNASFSSSASNNQQQQRQTYITTTVEQMDDATLLRMTVLARVVERFRFLIPDDMLDTPLTYELLCYMFALDKDVRPKKHQNNNNSNSNQNNNHTDNNKNQQKTKSTTPSPHEQKQQQEQQYKKLVQKSDLQVRAKSGLLDDGVESLVANLWNQCGNIKTTFRHLLTFDCPHFPLTTKQERVTLRKLCDKERNTISVVECAEALDLEYKQEICEIRDASPILKTIFQNMTELPHAVFHSLLDCLSEHPETIAFSSECAKKVLNIKANMSLLIPVVIVFIVTLVTVPFMNVDTMFLVARSGYLSATDDFPNQCENNPTDPLCDMIKRGLSDILTTQDVNLVFRNHIVDQLFPENETLKASEVPFLGNVLVGAIIIKVSPEHNSPSRRGRVKDGIDPNIACPVIPCADLNLSQPVSEFLMDSSFSCEAFDGARYNSTIIIPFDLTKKEALKLSNSLVMDICEEEDTMATMQFAMYQPSQSILAWVTVSATIPKPGFVLPRAYVQTLNLNTKISVGILAIFQACAFLWLMTFVFRRYRKQVGVLRTLFTARNTVQLILTALIISSFATLNSLPSNDDLLEQVAQASYIPKFDAIMTDFNMGLDLASAYVLLFYASATALFADWIGLSVISHLLSLSSADVVALLVVFFFIEMTFLTVGRCLFGTTNATFAFTSTSTVFLLKFFFAGVDIDGLKDEHPMLGTIFFFLYTFFVNVWMINMLIAVVTSQLGDVSARANLHLELFEAIENDVSNFRLGEEKYFWLRKQMFPLLNVFIDSASSSSTFTTKWNDFYKLNAVLYERFTRKASPSSTIQVIEAAVGLINFCEIDANLDEEFDTVLRRSVARYDSIPDRAQFLMIERVIMSQTRSNLLRDSILIRLLIAYDNLNTDTDELMKMQKEEYEKCAERAEKAAGPRLARELEEFHEQFLKRIIEKTGSPATATSAAAGSASGSPITVNINNTATQSSPVQQQQTGSFGNTSNAAVSTTTPTGNSFGINSSFGNSFSGGLPTSSSTRRRGGSMRGGSGHGAAASLIVGLGGDSTTGATPLLSNFLLDNDSFGNSDSTLQVSNTNAAADNKNSNSFSHNSNSSNNDSPGTKKLGDKKDSQSSSGKNNNNNAASPLGEDVSATFSQQLPDDEQFGESIFGGTYKIHSRHLEFSANGYILRVIKRDLWFPVVAAIVLSLYLAFIIPILQYRESSTWLSQNLKGILQKYPFRTFCDDVNCSSGMTHTKAFEDDLDHLGEIEEYFEKVFIPILFPRDEDLPFVLPTKFKLEHYAPLNTTGQPGGKTWPVILDEFIRRVTPVRIRQIRSIPKGCTLPPSHVVRRYASAERDASFRKMKCFEEEGYSTEDMIKPDDSPLPDSAYKFQEGCIENEKVWGNVRALYDCSGYQVDALTEEQMRYIPKWFDESTKFVAISAAFKSTYTVLNDKYKWRTLRVRIDSYLEVAVGGGAASTWVKTEADGYFLWEFVIPGAILLALEIFVFIFRRSEYQWRKWSSNRADGAVESFVSRVRAEHCKPQTPNVAIFCTFWIIFAWIVIPGLRDETRKSHTMAALCLSGTGIFLKYSMFPIMKVLSHQSAYIDRIVMSSLSAIKLIIPFYAVMSCSFVYAGHALFGRLTPQFSTLRRSVETITRGLLGDWQFEEIYNQRPFLAVVFTVLFVSIILVVLANVLVTLMNLAVDIAKVSVPGVVFIRKYADFLETELYCDEVVTTFIAWKLVDHPFKRIYLYFYRWWRGKKKNKIVHPDLEQEMTLPEFPPNTSTSTSSSLLPAAITRKNSDNKDNNNKNNKKNKDSNSSGNNNTDGGDVDLAAAAKGGESSVTSLVMDFSGAIVDKVDSAAEWTTEKLLGKYVKHTRQFVITTAGRLARPSEILMMIVPTNRMNELAHAVKLSKLPEKFLMSLCLFLARIDANIKHTFKHHVTLDNILEATRARQNREENMKMQSDQKQLNNLVQMIGDLDSSDSDSDSASSSGSDFKLDHAL